MPHRIAHPAFALAALIVLTACEDPARPVPNSGDGGSVFVDSDPQGGRILVDFVETGEVTPALVSGIEEGVRNITVELDTLGFTYSYSAYVTVATLAHDLAVSGPLTLRCSTPDCLRQASEFHSGNDIRFVVNAAGPLLAYEGIDVGITWPTTTSNSYVAVGMATMTALVDGEPVALGLGNAGEIRNFWAGRPLPTLVSEDPYIVRVPAWITPAVSTSQTRMRGLEVVQEVIADEDTSGVLTIRVTWTNISTDSLYRRLDPASPAQGLTYTDAWLGFILDADVGPFGESNDDLVSYSAERSLVYAYDGNFAVSGFSGGWSARPGLVGLMVLDGPGPSHRLNAWTAANDFAAGVNDTIGRLLLTATHTIPVNHPDQRIGFAPDDEDADYFLSVAVGPFVLAPGDSVSATFAVLLAAPAPGTFTSGQLMPAGDPNDGARPLAATAAPLLELADRVNPPDF